MKKYIKLSTYAKNMDMAYKTAFRLFKEGKIPNTYQDPNTKSIYVEDNIIENTNKTTRAILYARVSSTTNKASLDGQIERLRQYSTAKGYQIVGEYKEIASGLNENRKKLNQILDSKDFDILIVEHKDRLARFGTEYIERILKAKNQELEIVNLIENEKKELVDDFVAIITSFCGKIYGSNRKKKTEEIIKNIKEKE